MPRNIVQLVPPILNQYTILKKIDCVRPMRKGVFNISTTAYEHKGNVKTILNCYGHGGAGWTTIFGSVDAAIRLFEQLPKETTKKPIRVVGAGCMGLALAVELALRGYKIAGITAKSLYDTPSWKAAGYFAMVSVKASKEEMERLNEISIATFKVFQTIEQGKHPYFSKDAVCLMPVYTHEGVECGIESLEENGLIPPKEDVVIDFGNVQHDNFLRYWTYFLDTGKLMKQLFAEVGRLKIPIVSEEVHSFSQMSEDVVCNCSGLGSRELVHDKSLVSVRGHLVMLNEKAGTDHMKYMVYTKVAQEGSEEYICSFPKNLSVSPDDIQGTKCFGTLGATFIQGTDNLSNEQLHVLDEREYKKILDRSSYFFYGSSFPF